MKKIHIDGDELIPDEALAEEWGTTRRTLARYDQLADGLPYVLLSNRKYRPLGACREWASRRIRHPNPRRAAA